LHITGQHAHVASRQQCADADLNACISPVCDRVPSGKMMSTLPGCASSCAQTEDSAPASAARKERVHDTVANQVRGRLRKIILGCYRKTPDANDPGKRRQQAEGVEMAGMIGTNTKDLSLGKFPTNNFEAFIKSQQPAVMSEIAERKR
jgi:hypothetical protein